MPDFYLTFGAAHTPDRHPNLDVAHADGWVTITAADYETARAAACYLCGIWWCVIETEHTHDRSFFPRGELAHYQAISTHTTAGDLDVTVLDINTIIDIADATNIPDQWGPACNCHLAPAVLGQEARVHHLKTCTPHWQAIARDDKRAELRFDDRGFLAGDIAHLREWDNTPNGHGNAGVNGYTGRCCLRSITHVLPGGQFGLDNDYVALSLKLVYSNGVRP